MPVDTQRAFRPTLTLQRPPSPPLASFALQAPPPPPASQRANPARLNLASNPSQHNQDSPPVALFVQPASPALSSNGAFETSAERPSPEATTSFIPPTSKGFGGGLAARRQLNKKSLSLVVPSAPSSSSLLSPTTPSFLGPGGTSSEVDAETRSLPPSPVSLQAFIGVEGAEPDDRTIGRLMMKQQADEMREQMKGGRGMKRRTSIPRLNLAAPPTAKSGGKPSPMKLGSTNGGSAVQLLRRNGVERGSGGAVDSNEVAEEFPYALGPREIIPGIFLGSEQNARDPAVLREWGFGYVLNVAKEVECPWGDDVIEEEVSEEEESTPVPEETSTGSRSVSFAPSSSPSTSPSRARPKHRRTKTQAAVIAPKPDPARPLFVRPTASTPNLQSLFNSTTPSPPVPALPPLPQDLDALEHAAMARSFSSSPPQRRSPPRSRKSLQQVELAVEPTASSDGSVHFPANPHTGRPSLEYLWLKWGHDESDLVEALKFQSAFDFLDKARASNDGKGRVLVHCQCGVSRSATVVIAYCMREAAKALEEGREVAELASCTGMHDTYSFVKERSEWVGPNLGLVFQLVAYERMLRGGPDALDEDESPYPNYPPEEDSQPPVDYSHPGYSNDTSQSPRTPVSSEGSSASDSQLSTPEVDPPLPLSPVERASRKSSLSIIIGQPQHMGAVAIHDDEEEILSPLVQGLALRGRGEEHPSTELPDAPAFILPIPPSRSARYPTLSPLQHVVFPHHEQLDSPTTTARPSPSHLADSNPLDRLAVSSTPPPKPTPTPLSEPAASAAQVALLRGRPSLRLSASTSAAEGQVSGPPSPKALFGGSQTPSERRASHRRVFSDTMSLPAFLGRSSSTGALSVMAAGGGTKE